MTWLLSKDDLSMLEAPVILYQFETGFSNSLASLARKTCGSGAINRRASSESSLLGLST